MKILIEQLNSQADNANTELVKGQKITFGRSPDATILLQDQTASRLHCELDFTGPYPLLRDLNSSNGTFVNNEPLTSEYIINHDFTFNVGSNFFQASIIKPETKQDNNSSTVVSLLENNVNFDPTLASFSQKYDLNAGPFSAFEEMDQQLQTITGRINNMCNFSSHVLTLTNTKDILESAVSAVLDITGAQRCSAILLDHSSNLLNPVTFKYSDNNLVNGEFPVSTTIVRHVIRSGESVITTNAAEDERFFLGSSISDQDISSVMCVPLLGQENVLGTLYADNTGILNVLDEEALAIMAVVAHQSAVAIERVNLIDDLKRLFFGSIHALAASIEAKDRYTRGHSERVTCYSLMIADEMQLSERERDITELAGLLHDVGKIAIPEEVLCSVNKLSNEEFRLMQEHPDRGAEIILKMPELTRLASVKEVALGARHHHEKFDGSGYPDKLAGNKIPIHARILAVADTFDAITSTRTYRTGKDPQTAMDIILSCSGTQLDPEIVSAFERVFKRGDINTPQKVKAHIEFNQTLLAQSTASTETGQI